MTHDDSGRAGWRMVRSMKRILAAAVLAVIAPTILAGAAHAEPAEPSRASAPLPKKPAQVVSRFMTALEDGEGEVACSLLGKKYAAEQVALFVQAGYANGGDTCPEMIESLAVIVEEMGGFGKITTKTISATATSAKVRMTLVTDSSAAEVYRLRLVGGKWLIVGQAPARS